MRRDLFPSLMAALAIGCSSSPRDAAEAMAPDAATAAPTTPDAGTSDAAASDPTLSDASTSCSPGAHDLASPEDAPYGLLVAGNELYWTTAVLDGPKRVRHVGLAGGEPETLVETARELGALAADDEGAVYWVEATPPDYGGVVMVARPGQAPAELYEIAAGLDVFAVAVDATTVYWLVHGAGDLTQTVWSGPREGGTPAPLGSVSFSSFDPQVGALRSHGESVYWSLGTGVVYRVPQAGGEVETVLDEPDGLGGFDVTPDAVLAIVRDAATSVVRVDHATGARSVVNSGAGARWAIAVRDGRAFVSTADDRIVSFPAKGGEVAVEVTEGVRTAGAIAVTDDRVYWANTATAAAGGAVGWACRARSD